MNYDQWKTTDDTPEGDPPPIRCDFCQEEIEWNDGHRCYCGAGPVCCDCPCEQL